jgi:glycosyltransferase involved in cell wall biosynthesis
MALLLSLLSDMPEFEVSAVLLNEGRLADELRSGGIPTLVLPESHYNAASIASQLAAHLRRHPVDIVHTHKWKDNVLAAAATIGSPVRCRVRTIHGRVEPFTGFKAVKVLGVRALDHIVNRCAVDRIVAVSRDLALEFAATFGVGKVAHIQNGIDLRRVSPTKSAGRLRAEMGISPEAPVIGTVGRLFAVKGLDVFLTAARQIRNARPDAQFVIAGSGPLEASLRATAQRLGLADVRFLGHRDDACDVIGMMDVFVLPSLNEGIPMALLEALALARPVVASRVGGIPEIIQHNISGVLTEPGNTYDVARQCLSLLGDRETARRLGIAGRERVEQRFSADVMAAQMAAAYRLLVANERRTRSWAVRTGDAS